MSHPMIAPLPSRLPNDQLPFVLPPTEFSELLNQTRLPPAINLPALIERCSDNVEFALLLLKEFESTGHQRATDIHQSVANADFAAIERVAHGLRGVAGTLDAEKLCELAGELNAAAHVRNLNGVTSFANQLETEMQRCLSEIPNIRASSQSTLKQSPGESLPDSRQAST